MCVPLIVGKGSVTRVNVVTSLFEVLPVLSSPFLCLLWLVLQVIAVLCDRNAIEIKRYGHPMGFSKTPKMTLIQAVCGRGEWCSHSIEI